MCLIFVSRICGGIVNQMGMALLAGNLKAEMRGLFVARELRLHIWGIGAAFCVRVMRHFSLINLRYIVGIAQPRPRVM